MHRTESAEPVGLLGARPPSRRGLAFVAMLLLLACLPDAMLPPVLRSLVIDRFGATEPQAHWFMTVNLLGALAAIPLLSRLRRAFSPSFQIAGAAFANALLLLLLAVPTSLGVALALRTFEGAADMIAFAVLLDLIAKAGGSRAQGRRLGVATTVLMLGLAGGAILGGQLGARSEEPLLVLGVGAAICVVVGLLAIVGAPLLRRAIATCPAVEADPTHSHQRTPLWTIVLMMGSDRMLGGLLTVTVPLLLTTRLAWASDRVGGMIALPLLLMALGAYPAGRIADRIGNLFCRTVAALVYAAALAFVPIASSLSQNALLITLLVLGLAASALMPTAMALAARTGRGAVAMGAGHAGGNVGYALGIAGAGALLALLGGSEPSPAIYAMVIQLFALAHVVVTGLALVESRWGGSARPVVHVGEGRSKPRAQARESGV